MALRISCGSRRQTVGQNTTILFSFVLMLAGAALIPITANGQVWVNPGSGTWKWEDPSNWSGGAPSSGQPATFITNGVAALNGFRFRTVTIDSTTSGGSPGAMTINNLTISAPGSGVSGSHSSLFLNNAGSITPLDIVNSCAISKGGSLNITNSTLIIDGVSGGETFGIDGPVTLGAQSTLIAQTITNVNFSSPSEAVGVTASGTLTVQGGTNIVGISGLEVGGPPGSIGTVLITDGAMFATNTVDGFVSGISIGDRGVGSLAQFNGTVQTFYEDVATFSQGTLTVAGGTHTIFGIDGLTVGDVTGSTGTVWVTGGQLLSSIIWVGGISGGTGSLSQSNGTVQVDGETIGPNPGACGTLTIAGGTHILGHGLLVGFSSTGTVWLTGGQLLATSNQLGALTIGASLFAHGVGSLTQSNGMLLAQSAEVGFESDSVGSWTAVGGTSSIYSNMTVGDCVAGAVGTIFVRGGGLFVTNAAHNAVLDVRNGWVVLTAGQLTVDKLVMTNSCGFFFHGGGVLNVGSLLLDPNLDADDDGLPNGWEQAYGLDPLSSTGNNGGDGDPDGDGFTNIEEYQGGSNPTDPNSIPFRITSIARQGNDVLLTWLTAGGKTNVLQATNGGINGNYATNGFSNIGPTIFVSGNGLTTTNYVDAGGATNKPARYYRVRQVP